MTRLMGRLFRVTWMFVLLGACCVQAMAAGADTPTASPTPTASELSLGMPFTDNAIFQQGMAVPVWGTSQPGAKITVTFNGQTVSTTAGKDGAGRSALKPMQADKLKTVNDAPKGRTLTVISERDGKTTTKSIGNVLIGEVWLCSGQSNMAGRFGRDPYPRGSLEKADYPALRKIDGDAWVASTPQTAGRFSRVAFCFARRIQRDILVPIGLLTAATAGSPIESWMPVFPEGLPSKYAQKNKGKPWHAGNYETKIVPLVGYAMRGAIWYQGEGNAGDGREYFLKMKSMIGEWRKRWGQGDFPFYYVQIASIGKSSADNPACGDGRAKIRNAQLEALTLKNTGMAVTIDIGSVHEHPMNKYDVGIRLARWALHNEYGQADLVPSGPIYKSCKVEGGAIRVQFEYAQNGLMLASKDGYLPPKPTPDAKMPWLSIQAKDGTWHWATGKIDGSDLVVSSKDVKDPVAVRYAYTQYPLGCNLYNKDGLPASPFSTGGY